MTPSDCSCCRRLNDAEIRRAFTEKKALSGGGLSMDVPWHDAVSPEGRPAVRAKFFCNLCGQTIEVVVELKGEPDPSDWWKDR